MRPPRGAGYTAWDHRLTIKTMTLLLKESTGPVLLIALLLCAACDREATVSGNVVDDSGPVAGATVRIQATENETVTDYRGRFTLTGLQDGQAVTVSAWKEEYYCAKIEQVIPPAQYLRFVLIRYQTDDNPEYEWMPPTGQESCATCKPAVTALWQKNAHAGSAANVRFFNMFNGTDTEGNQSPPTRYSYQKDYGIIPLPPDPDKPYYGPGYKLDFPDTTGNCCACHIPGAAVNDPYGIDPNTVSGADTFGVHCDYCHKVAGVTIDNETGLPYPNMPGVLSSDVRRPFPDDPDRYQLFFGTFDDDNVPEEDTYLPLIEESRFCAPCHFGMFWDTLVYNSFGEWLESPYSDPETGQTCQQCHMPAPSVYNGEVITNVAPEEGGIERDPNTIHAHLQLGAMDEEFLQDALTMNASARRDNGTVVVEVKIINDNTGHHIPTDSPLRHLILVVEAKDASGGRLAQLGGQTIPEWCGQGDPQEGYYAGLPGTAFAKILEELWTQVWPTGAYWNHTRLRSDNRIAAMQWDNSTYTFGEPAGGTANVSVKLLFRRAFIELMDLKQWDHKDIVMAEQSLSVE